MAINETITLQGVPQVKDQLAQVTAASQQTSTAINQIGAQGGSTPIQNVFVQLKAGADSMKATTSASNDLKLSLNAMKPVLGDLGVAMVPFREFARLGTESFVALGAAVGGTILVSLTKFNEQLQVTQANLQALTGGTSAFQTVQAQAEKTGVSIENLATVSQTFIKAFQDAAAKTSTVKFIGEIPPGVTQSYENAIKLGAALVAQLEAAGVSSAEAVKGATAFGDALDKNGKVTGDMLRALQNVSPVVAKAFAQFLTGSGNVAQAAAQLDKFPASLQNISLQIASATPKWVEFTNPKPVTDLIGATTEFSKALDGLKTKISPIADEFSTSLATVGADFIKQNGDNFAKGLDLLLNHFTDFVKALPEVLAAQQVNFDGLGTAFQTALDTMLGDWKDWLAQLLVTDVNFDGITQAFQNMLSSLQSAWQTFWQSLSNVQAPQLPSNFGTGMEAPFASGGFVRGPGSATSDSIMARLSAGEFVLNAAAVQRYGVSFIAALNSMQAPRLMPSASTMVPRFAAGGAVTTAPTSAVHLHFPGSASFQTIASESVATSLRHYATKSRYISIGPKPSWY